ncbi:uncharacterized protein [Anabrus simplex]|uniref:uncharacterized protein n=1 Tax=Anabrus simplex TaxID=316456 RepID=UPI0035A3A032
MENRLWTLEKYARFGNGNWNQIDGNGRDLVLSVVGIQLLVMQQDTVLESIALSAGPATLRGVWKNSTLIIVLTYPSQTRRLRFKFSASKDCTDVQNCQSCIRYLQSYMSIRNAQEPNKQNKVKLEEVYTSIILDKSYNTRNTPAPYTVPPNFPLEVAIRTCILDPGFPEFVRQVDSCLKKLAAPGTE